MDNILKMVQSFKSNLDPRLDSMPSGVTSLALGTEDSTSDRMLLTEKRNDVLAGVADAFKYCKIGTEDSAGIELEDYQIRAGEMVAAYALDPLKTLQHFSVQGRRPVNIGAEDAHQNEGFLDMGDVMKENAVVSVESFDAQNLKASVRWNIITTALTIKQDPVAELFFPIIPIEPNMAGATVKATILSIMKEFQRNIDGSSNKDNYQLTPLIKAANDPVLIDIDKNKLIPVYRTESATRFIAALTTTENNGDEDVPTAPLIVGETINILGISQNDAQIAKGQADTTDALDRRYAVKSLYISLTNATPITEYFKYDLTHSPVVFTYSVRDHNKDLILNFESNKFVIDTTNTTTATDETSTILAALPAGYKVFTRIVLSGTGNTMTGDVSVYGSKIAIDHIETAAGETITSGTDYDALVAGFASLKIEGYDPDAYATDSNARRQAIVLTSNTYTEVYPIQTRTGYKTITPVVSNGDDGDANYINAQVNAGRFKLNMSSHRALSEYVEYIRATESVEMMQGISNKYVGRSFVSESVVLTEIVDGINSNTREEDVRKALFLKIRNAGIAMALESNYSIAYDLEHPGEKKTLIIGTDPQIAAFLGEPKPDAVFNYVVAASPNPYIAGKIRFSFGRFGGNRNKQADFLNFGQCFWRPELTVPVQKSVNNRVAYETTTYPGYTIVPNLPIIGEYIVTGLDSVIGKLTVNMKSV